MANRCDLCLAPNPTGWIPCPSIQAEGRHRVVCVTCAVTIADALLDTGYLKVYQNKPKRRRPKVNAH